MAIHKVQAPDGSIMQIEAPDGATEDQVIAFAATQFAQPAAQERPKGILEQARERAQAEVEAKKAYDESVAANKKFQLWDAAGNVANVFGGAVRGAGSIGSTLMLPIDAATDWIKGDREKNIAGLVSEKQPLSRNQERRQAIDEGLSSLGYNPDSTSYKVGKVAAEIAGTAPIGGVIASGAKVAGASPAVVSALESGGFALNAPTAATVGGKAAQYALRAGAGGLLGATQAGMIDPESIKEGALIGAALPIGVKGAGEAGKAVNGLFGSLASNTLGATTGAGTEAIKQAYSAGKNGATEFLDNMRGKVDIGDVVDQAKQGIANMRQARGDAYRSGMVDISNDKSVIDFAPINEAMNKVSNMGSYKGVKINSKSADTVDELSSIINEWKNLDPAEYHTPEGIDALKKAVGDIRDSQGFGTPARKAADTVYNAVKNEITNQTPAYAKVMKDYQESSKALDDIESALSLGKKAKVDTSVRKLQSLMRNNAQTNYGNRLNLANTLEEQGGVDLMPALAGQSMNSWTPRGMTGAIEKGALGLSAFMAPQALGLAPFASPRLMGELAYKLGSATGRTKTAGSKLIRGGLLDDPELLNSTSLLLQTAPRVSLTSQARQQ